MKIEQRNAWQLAFAAWRAYCEKITARAKAITERQHERGWQMAASVGIPRDGCCLHNASIDDSMTGWCKDNPTRLRVAKRANAITSDWRASRAADRMIKAKWDELLGPMGAPRHRATKLTLV